MRRSSAIAEARTADGIVFDSALECRHYHQLKALQHAGRISKLQCQPKFVIFVNGVRICSYSPDFTYLDDKQAVRVEDVKAWTRSAKTGKMLPRVNREFGIKVKLMLAVFGITVECV